jgi:hypothetical protein
LAKTWPDKFRLDLTMKLKVINAHKKRSSDGSNGQILLYLYVHEAVWVELSSKNRLKY